MTKLVFFDLETGGFDPERHAVIQIAAAACDLRLAIKEEIELKIKFPPSAADPEALAINCYSEDAWVDALMPAEAEARFSAFLKRHATKKCTSRKGNAYYVAQGVAHNGAAFDGPFLKAWYSRRDAFCPMYPLVLDTCQLAQWKFLHETSRPENYKLETLAFYFDLWKPGEYHDALDDVRATIEICRHLQLHKISETARLVLTEGRTIHLPD